MSIWTSTAKAWRNVAGTSDGAPAGAEVRGAARRSDHASADRPRVHGPAAVLAASALFDAEWYACRAGCDSRPLSAARHYLRRGARRGIPPHPLFAPEHAVAACPALAEGSDPLLAYLGLKAFDVATHPLFDVKSYLSAHPEAAGHPDGPAGHYVEVGAAAGFAPNDWYQVDDGEPRGLADWVATRYDRWAECRSQAPRVRSTRHEAAESASFADEYAGVRHPAAETIPADLPHPDTSPFVVSVVVEALTDEEALIRSLRSVVAQDFGDWEVLLVTDGTTPELSSRVAVEFPDAPISFVPSTGSHPAAGINLALQEASGGFIAFLSPGEEWEPGRLRLLVSVCLRESVPVAYDSMLVRRQGQPDVFLGGAVPPVAPPRSLASVDLSRMLVAATALRRVGPLDPSMLGAWTVDLSFRLMLALDACHVPVLGVVRDGDLARSARRLPEAVRPFPEHATIPTWVDVAFNRHAIDWKALQERESRPDVVTVIVPTYQDWRLTLACLRSLGSAVVPAGMTVDCIVWDNGSAALTSQVLDSFEDRFTGVRVLHAACNFGYALGNNLALRAARGDTVIFLNNDTRVDPGWLAPLVTLLEDPAVLGAQSLLLYPTGTVQSGGVAFPSCGGVPYNFLQGFPVEDAGDIGELDLSALTGAALALRFRDVVAQRGFDPLYRNGMEDVDLCLRLRRTRGAGSFRVSPRSRVTHFESRTPGRYDKSIVNRQLFLDRWGRTAPRDDERLWTACGFEVLDHGIRNPVSKDRRACVPEPVLRRRRAVVVQHPPRLRWALKIAPPAGELAEAWGDTHFARRLAVALRELDQEVVIDHRQEFGRRSGHLDDVVLTLRGLEPFQPEFGQVSLAWVISHPEQVSFREAVSYDRVLAASSSWSAKMSQAWGLRVEPLLQATDPDLFYPGRAAVDAGHAVLFVGGSRQQYRRIVRDSVSIGLPLAVYGSDWEDFIPSDYIKARHVPNSDVGALYAAAGVVLNDHWDDMREQGFISNRLFDAAASGARVITDDVTGLDGLFGASVQVARDADDLSRLAAGDELDSIFGGEKERRAVALRVHREHSFLTRAHRLLEVALQAQSRQGPDADLSKRVRP